MSTIKTGWLEKQGSGLIWKSWKRKYCVLYGDGEFSMYESPTDAKADTRIQVQTDIRMVNVGRACGDISLPKSQSNVDALFCVLTKNDAHYFYAESDAECRSWVNVLEQTRATALPTKVHPAPPPPYAPPAYPQPTYSQPVRGSGPAAGPRPAGYYPPPQPGYVPAGTPMYGQPAYGAPMYGQPMYGQPMYGQPMYVSQQQQPQQRDNSTRNMLLAGGGGLLGIVWNPFAVFKKTFWRNHLSVVLQLFLLIGSGIFGKSWKSKHCVLYGNGKLSIFDSVTDSHPDTEVQMQTDVQMINVGPECGEISLPRSRTNIDTLFCIRTKKTVLYFSAQSAAECRDWVNALEHSRTLPLTQVQRAVPPPVVTYPRDLGLGGPATRRYNRGQPQIAYVPVQGRPITVSTVHSNNAGNMIIAGGTGAVGGYMMGNMMAHNRHMYHHNLHHGIHHGIHHNSGIDHGSGFDSGIGGIDCGSGFGGIDSGGGFGGIDCGGGFGGIDSGGGFGGIDSGVGFGGIDSGGFGGGGFDSGGGFGGGDCGGGGGFDGGGCGGGDF